MGDEQNEDCEHWGQRVHTASATWEGFRNHRCSDENRRAPVNLNAHIVDH